MECVHSTQEAIKDTQLLEMLKAKYRETQNKFTNLLKIKQDKMIDRPMEMLQSKYTKSMVLPYRKEIHEFIHDVKGVIKSNKENKVTKTFLLGTKSTQVNEKLIKETKHASRRSTKLPPKILENVTPRGSVVFDDDETTLGTEMDFSDGEDELDDEVIEYVKQQQKDLSNRVDTLYAYCLNTICSVMYQEQQQIARIFLLDTKQEEISANIEEDEETDKDEEKSDAGNEKKSTDGKDQPSKKDTPVIRSSDIHIMMEKMFQDINQDFADITKYVERKTDKFYALAMSLAVEKQFRTYSGKSTYISEFIIFCRGLIQQVIQKFITKQVESIDEFKCTIKKIHIVPFVAKFSYFNDRFESILMNFSDMNMARTSATTDYLKIIKSMFAALEKLADTNEKHKNAFRMKNYSYFYHSLNKRPNLSQNEELMKQNEIAKQRFEESCRKYIIWMINFKFELLFQFIEGLEDCIKTTSKEDIVYQKQFSKDKVKEILKKYDADVLKKGLQDIMKRMDKHIGQKNADESTYKIPKSIEERGPKVLHREVWTRLRRFFIAKYDVFESIVTECYGFKPVASIVVESYFDEEEKKL